MKRLLSVGLILSVVVAVVGAQTPPSTETRPEGANRGAAAARMKAPPGVTQLGRVQIPRRVLADGKPLAPGAYDVRVTQDEARPRVAGATPRLERWAEFLQNGEIKGREVVSIVPGDAIAQVEKEPPPPAGGHRVEMLKGDKYLRIWINHGGDHYLFHLPPA